MTEVTRESIRLLIKNISSNNMWARDAEREGDVRWELQAHLWALQDTMRLLVGWNGGSSEIDSHTAQTNNPKTKHPIP
jgi:hypothetical protein